MSNYLPDAGSCVKACRLCVPKLSCSVYVSLMSHKSWCLMTSGRQGGTQCYSYLLIPIQEETQYLNIYIPIYLIENNLCFRYEDVWLAIVNWCSAEDTRHHVFKELGTRAFKNIHIYSLRHFLDINCLVLSRHNI